MENKDITICLTSCGRFDLLERTIKSLVENWDGPKPKEVFIFDDSFPLLHEHHLIIAEIVSRLFGNWRVKYCLMSNRNHKNGQIKGIDILYSKVKTPYIMHLEDDWEFFKTGFIQPSLSILEENPHILQVWLRETNDRNKHPATGRIKMTSDRVKFQMMKTGHAKVWNGHSFNPGLRRLSDYKKVFPNGFVAAVSQPMNGLKSEAEIGEIYMKSGYRAATLLTGYVRHIGNGRHVK